MRLQTRTRERSCAANLSRIPGIQLNSLEAAPSHHSLPRILRLLQIGGTLWHKHTTFHQRPADWNVRHCFSHPTYRRRLLWSRKAVLIMICIYGFLTADSMWAHGRRKKQVSLRAAWSIHAKHMLNKQRCLLTSLSTWFISLYIYRLIYICIFIFLGPFWIMHIVLYVHFIMSH